MSIHTGPAIRGSVQVVVLFTEKEKKKNNKINFQINSYNDQYSKHDHQVMFELPTEPLK